jgi:hypothetical protein
MKGLTKTRRRIIAGLFLIGVVAWWVLPRLLVKDPLKARVIGYRWTSDIDLSVKYEVLNTSQFPVVLITSTRFDTETRGELEQWASGLGGVRKGIPERLEPGARTIVEETVYVDSSRERPIYLWYGWEPALVHPFAQGWLSINFRIGMDGPFTFDRPKAPQKQ